MYVANQGSSNVTVIDAATNSVVDSIAGGPAPSGLAYDMSTGFLFITEDLMNGTVRVVNTSDFSLVTTLVAGVEPLEAAFDSSNGNVYVTNSNLRNVTVINGSTAKVVNSLPAGPAPWGVVADNSNRCVYVTNIQASTVSVIGEELAVSVNSSARVTDVGLNVSFGARASGGLPPLVYSYAWTFGDGGTIGVTGNATIHRFQGTASHTVMVIATGTDGFSVANSTTVIVNAKPVVSTPAGLVSATGGSVAMGVDSGQAVTLAALATLGTPPYTGYSWSGLPGECSSKSDAKISCEMTTPGNLSIDLTVTDSARSDLGAEWIAGIPGLPGANRICDGQRVSHQARCLGSVHSHWPGRLGFLPIRVGLWRHRESDRRFGNPRVLWGWDLRDRRLDKRHA